MSIDLVHLLILIIAANAAPILIRQLLNNKLNYAVDAGHRFYDGHRILGDGVTWRGLASAVILTPVIAMLLSYSLTTGLLVAIYAMLGDMLASFIKRRLGMQTSSMAPLLDQVPESLLPALFLRHEFGLDWNDVYILLVLFFILELILSYLFFKLGIRSHPY